MAKDKNKPADDAKAAKAKASNEKAKAEGKAAKAKKDAPEKGGSEKGGKKGKGSESGAVSPRLRDRYFQEVRPALATACGRDNIMSLPRLEKIVVNMGVGAATQDKKFLETAQEALGLITGQKPAVTRAKKAISGFRLREGMPIGCKVTLRGKRMYEFMDRLISLALPRVRDFRGVSRKAFDGHGNYSLGLAEQLVFPELNPDKFQRTQGLNVSFVVSNATDEESREFLTRMGMPFQSDEKNSRR